MPMKLRERHNEISAARTVRAPKPSTSNSRSSQSAARGLKSTTAGFRPQALQSSKRYDFRPRAVTRTDPNLRQRGGNVVSVPRPVREDGDQQSFTQKTYDVDTPMEDADGFNAESFSGQGSDQDSDKGGDEGNNQGSSQSSTSSSSSSSDQNSSNTTNSPGSGYNPDREDHNNQRDSDDDEFYGFQDPPHGGVGHKYSMDGHWDKSDEDESTPAGGASYPPPTPNNRQCNGAQLSESPSQLSDDSSEASWGYDFPRRGRLTTWPRNRNGLWQDWGLERIRYRPVGNGSAF